MEILITWLKPACQFKPHWRKSTICFSKWNPAWNKATSSCLWSNAADNSTSNVTSWCVATLVPSCSRKLRSITFCEWSRSSWLSAAFCSIASLSPNAICTTSWLSTTNHTWCWMKICWSFVTVSNSKGRILMSLCPTTCSFSGSMRVISKKQIQSASNCLTRNVRFWLI